MNCPICTELPNERFDVKYVSAAKCSSCGHIYAVNVATDHGVQELPDPDTMLSTYTARNRRLVKFWRKSGFLADNSRLLDFGAGSGHTLRSLTTLMPGVQISCIEANPTASGFLRSQGFSVFDTLSTASADTYDAILLIELLEHLSDPVSFLKEVKACLRPSGQIFMSTPMGETRTGNRKLQAYDTPEHVQFWTEKSFARCCAQVGMAFHPCHPGIMYPRTNRLIGLARDAVQTVRNVLTGRRHLVGFLSLC